MTYKKLIKELDDHTKRADGATVIDELVAEFGQVIAFDALDSIADFWKSSTMLQMRYWWDGTNPKKREACKKIMRELGRLYPQYTNEVNYFLNA